MVAISKISLMFFLDRETGKPIYPVEERPVPQSEIPGEHSSKTQPFPVKPPPLARLSMTPDEVFKGEPEHEKFCQDLVAKIGGVHNLGAYTPYSEKEFRMICPGQRGGAAYGGMSVDPNLRYGFVYTRDVRAAWAGWTRHPADRSGSLPALQSLGQRDALRALLGSRQITALPAAAMVAALRH